MEAILDFLTPVHLNVVQLLYFPFEPSPRQAAGNALAIAVQTRIVSLLEDVIGTMTTWK